MDEGIGKALARTREFALESHGYQRYGVKDYIFHLDHVEQVLCRFGYHDNITLRCGALLHDVVEDTDVTEAILRSHFSPELCDLVMAVTDLPAGKEETFRRMTSQMPSAIILKMADRIANVEACLAEGSRTIMHMEKYIKEWPMMRGFLKPQRVDAHMYKYLGEILRMTSARTGLPLEY